LARQEQHLASLEQHLARHEQHLARQEQTFYSSKAFFAQKEEVLRILNKVLTPFHEMSSLHIDCE
jgi:hypothetical protein